MRPKETCTIADERLMRRNESVQGELNLYGKEEGEGGEEKRTCIDVGEKQTERGLRCKERKKD